MNTKAQLKKFEESLDIIRSITRAFEHTATQKMVVNRNEIERLKVHLNEIKQTYMSTKVSIRRKNVPKDTLVNSTVRVPTRSKVVILISSEPEYYSNLLDRMASEFISEVKSGADGIVIGKPGRDEVDKRIGKKINYSFFDFDDNKPDWPAVNKVSQILLQYAQIVVIFCQFRSILAQDVIKEDIAGKVTEDVDVEAKKYLIKPDSKTALEYLEHQLITGNFLQKLYENGLAKSAIRVKILEIGEIAERLAVAMDMFERYKRKVNREINNRKLINLYSGSSVWHEQSIFTVYR